MTVAEQKREAERLMNELLAFAKRMLLDHGEFHPFGGKVLPDKSIVHVAASTLDDFPSAKDLVAVMLDQYRRDVTSHELIAAAVVTNVTIRRPGQGDLVDAIEVRVAHVNGYSADVFLPYVRAAGEVVYDAPFAQRGDQFLSV
jgi:hypothetical protein